MRRLVANVVGACIRTMSRHRRRSVPPGRLGHVDHAYRARHDVVRYEVQSNAVIHVFWKDLPLGKGPGASLFVHGDEVLRFDCFGEDKGHLHVALCLPEQPSEERLYFAETTVEEQIERTLFELNTNLGYYLQRNPNPAVRAIEIRHDALARVCQRVRQTMYEYLANVPALRYMSAAVVASPPGRT